MSTIIETNTNIKTKRLTKKEKLEKAKLIIDLVNEYFITDCATIGRKSYRTLPRQMAMYYIRKYLNLPFAEIGKLFPSNFGKKKYKDHATVIHACKTIKDLIEFDFEIKEYNKDLDSECNAISTLNEKDLQKRFVINKLLSKFEEMSLIELDEVVKLF